MTKAFQFLIFVIAASLGASAATITVGPANCSSSAVNTAISSAVDGDTVLLTCVGTASWTTTVSIPSTKGITLQVQNGTNGTWNAGHTARTGANFPLTVVVSSSGNAIVAVANTNNSVIRISGFLFQNSGSSDPFLEIAGCGNGTANLGAFRIDNNYFDTVSALENVAIWAGQAGGCKGQLWGLIDNNTFHNIYRASDTTFGPYNIQIWNYWHSDVPANQCWGCNGWTDNDFLYGSEHEVFVEDNLFEQTAGAPGHMRHYISAELGARYVSRYNTFANNFPDSNADLHDAHGLCLVGSNGPSARGGEIYHNLITGTGYDRGAQLRGGSWLVYSNTITAGAGDAIQFEDYRAGDSSMFGQCSATSNLVLMPPWPVPTGAAWSSGAAWKSQAATNGSDYQLPMQIFNSYAWNNLTPGSVVIMPAVDSRGVESTYIQNGRDYFASADGSQPAGIASYTPYAYPDPLQGISAPIASLSQSSVNCGNSQINSATICTAVTLTNTGGATLNISSIAIGGTNTGDFTQGNNCPAALGAGLNCSITPTFTPTVGGARSAAINITDDAAGSPQSIALSGTGGIPVASLSPSSLVFGSLNVSGSSAPQSLTLSNTGTAALSITSISFTGSNTGDFFQSNNCPVGSSLGTSSSCTITVTFTPLAVGARSASLSVADGAAGSPHTSTLSGTGVQPIIAGQMNPGARMSGRAVLK